jgi:hypothetical protein
VEGNVGIGTTNPNYKLDVIGDINASNYYINGTSIFDILDNSTVNRSIDLSSYSQFGASVDDTELTNEDFGEFTCTGNEDGCTLDANAYDDEYYDSESDLTGLLDDDYVDVDESPSAGDISGSFSAGLTIGGDKVQVAELDDGSDTASNDDVVMIDNGDNTQFIYIDVPDCDDTSGKHLNYNTADQTFSCGTSGDGTGTDDQTLDEAFDQGGTIDGASAHSANNEVRIGDADDYVAIAEVGEIPTIYGTGAYLRIGDAATANVASAEDDLLVTGALEVDGELELDGALDADSTATFAGAITIASGVNLQFADSGTYIDGTATAMTIEPDDELTINADTFINMDGNTLYVDASGNKVGIGTASPTSELDVHGDINLTGNISFADGSYQDTGYSWHPRNVTNTTSNHDGNFGGYAAMNVWMQSNGCAGYHVCSASEITAAAQAGMSIPLWVWYNTGAIAIINVAGGYLINDCSGWYSNSAYGYGTYWAATSMGYGQCSIARPVACCK